MTIGKIFTTMNKSCDGRTVTYSEIQKDISCEGADIVVRLYNRVIFSSRERKSPAESFLKFRYDLKFPPELPVRKPWLP